MLGVPHISARVGYDEATRHLDPPLAIVDLAAFDHNAADLVRRAAAGRSGWPASRCAPQPARTRARGCPATRACWATRCAEALWLCDERHGLATTCWSPTRPTDHTALRELAGDEAARAADHDHGRLDRAPRPGRRRARYRPPGHPGVPGTGRVVAAAGAAGVVHIGTRRSPVHTAAEAAAFAKADRGRPGFTLVGDDGLRGADRRARRQPARSAGCVPRRCAGSSGARRAELVSAAQRGGRRGARVHPAGVRQRRRHRQHRDDVGRLVGDRGRRGLRADRADPVRRLPQRSPRSPRCCSRCRWCAGRRRTPPRCSPAATSRPAAGHRTGCPRPTCRRG